MVRRGGGIITSHVVTTTTNYSTLAVADGDDITINSGGVLSLDSGWAGADGSRGINGIAVNLNAIHIQDAGTTCKIKDTYEIQITEGGQWRSLGAVGNRCAITGSNTATNTHYIQTYIGGKFYIDYTDISGFYYGIYSLYGGFIEMQNSTITGIGRDAVVTNRGVTVFLVNCSLASGSTFFVFTAADVGVITAINCTLTSNTDNRLASSTYGFKLVLAGCTYQGIGIIADDFPNATLDYDIRIYEESSITETNGESDVIIGSSHPSMDAEGMLYDDTNYIKIPGCINIPPTVTGISKAYILQKSAYWRSGLAVVSRTWVYWSDSGQAETGDNQKWTIYGGKTSYSSDTDTDWAGNAMTLNITAPTIQFRMDGQVFS